MAQEIREVMTPDPICLPADASVREAAASMRGQGVGDVLVVEGDRLRGIRHGPGPGRPGAGHPGRPGRCAAR